MEIKKLEEQIKSLGGELNELKQKNRASVKKLGIRRFNPFGSLGGDQSFSLVLLDENNDGVVMTSLFAQEGNRVYAKPIKKGASEYVLSDEERQMIDKFLQS